MSKRWYAAVAVVGFALGLGLALGVARWFLSRQNVYKSENNTELPEIIEQDTAAPAATGEPEIVRVLTTGDVMLGRSVNSIGARRRDFGWSLAEVAAPLEEFDYVIANLETPIITACPVTDEGMLFCADASAAGALAASPIDLVTLANNHIYNYGRDGYEQTRKLLASAGEASVGADEEYTFTLGGQTFGVIAYDDVTFPVALADWQALVRERAARVDHLLVALHFGVEYQYQPTPRQVELAHAAIDAGARLVIGNHSHWLGTVEKYGDGAIIYSHGNFVFDQEWARETKSGLAAAWTFRDGQLAGVELWPIFITNYGLAHWEAGTPRGDEILRTFLRESGNGELVDGRVVITW